MLSYLSLFLIASRKNSQIPPSVSPPTSLHLLLVSSFVCAIAPTRLRIGTVLRVSPNLPTYPSSEAIAVTTEERLSISATVTVPYSEVIEPQAEPELSDKHIVLPLRCGMLLTEISIHSSSASRIIGLCFTSEQFSIAL